MEPIKPLVSTDLAGVKVSIPRSHIMHSSKETSCSHNIKIWNGILPAEYSSFVGLIGPGPIANDHLVIIVEMSLFHTQGTEEPFSGKRPERLTSHPLHDYGKQSKPRIRIQVS